MKSIIRLFLPPIFYKIKAALNKKKYSSYRGNFNSWSEVSELFSDNYDSPHILESVEKAAFKVKNGEAVFERDSVCFYEKDYRYPILSNLLSIANFNSGNLSVLDFGGSLGCFYNQHMDYLKRIKNLKWSIVEQENFVKSGRENFQEDGLRFYFSIEECLVTTDIDVVLFSSVIQYLEFPHDTLKEVFAARPDFILFDRTIFIDGEDDRLTIQHSPKRIFSASTQCWFFSKTKFIENMRLAGYHLVEEVDCVEEVDYEDDSNLPEFKGMLFSNNALYQ
jgi:putative methyltransferase (TIGR04325 family)